MQKGKIIYFDYWTVGIHNFKVFDESLRHAGLEVKLIHLGSWRDPNTPAYQEIDGIKCYDISYFKTKLLYNIIRDEAPDAIITLNASFTIDRAITMICRNLGIKLIYLMHGIMTREEYIEDSIRETNRSRKEGLLRKVVNQLKGIVPNYLFSLYKYDKKYFFKSYPYKLLVNTLLNPTRYLNFPPASFDLDPDLSLVYGNIDFRFYERRLFDKKKSVIKVVGNPGLDSYFQQFNELPFERDSFLSQYNIPLNKPYVTYLEEGFVQDKFWTVDRWLAFCETLLDVCTQSGRHLVIKLHPRTANSPYLESLRRLENLSLVDRTNLPKLINFTDKCISHYSTTLIYPILLNKPIFVPRWGDSASLVTLYNEREVTFIDSLESLKANLLKQEFAYDRSQYINDYIPYTDGKTGERIVQAILETVSG
jgi:hypothetical protein